jgi:RNA polymerase sigma-70 factor, ECF subfamily
LITDPDAEFTALVMRQSRFVFRVAYAVLLNPYDAEDAVQETFMKLFRNRGWQHAENERAYLARVTWRVAIDMRPRSSVLVDPSSNCQQIEDRPSLHPRPDEVLLAADQHTTIHSMIDALPGELRLPLVLSAFDELNSREIGKILGIPEGTVRTRLQRGRQMLRSKLACLQETRYA